MREENLMLPDGFFMVIMLFSFDQTKLLQSAAFVNVCSL